MVSTGRGAALSFSDRFFSYETFKVLRVHDRRLGGLYRLFQATILIYIATSIIYQQRYLKTENIINGAVRITLKAPSDGIASPAYCSSTSSPCIYWNENDILFEPSVDGALVTTRAQITQYGPCNNQSDSVTSTCNVNVPTVSGCDPYNAPSTLLLPTSLVADIERFTLMLEHSIRGQASGVQMRSGNMDSGLLRDSQSGEVLRTFTDESRYVSASSGNDTKLVHLAGDVMTMGEFLRASGVNLDDLSRSPTASAGETVRTSGVVVIVVIQYAAKGWNPNRITYEYLPKAIPDQEYKVIETIRDFRDGNRVEINRHGVRIVFSQAGQLGQFSLMTLLTNLVAAVALFKVANIVVELMMLRIHPQKKVYVRAKFENTNDENIHGKDTKQAGGTLSRGSLQEDIAQSQDEMEQGTASCKNRQMNHQGQGFGQSSGRNSHQRDPYDTDTSSEEGDGYEGSRSNIVITQNSMVGRVEARYETTSGTPSDRALGSYPRSRASVANWGRDGSSSRSIGRSALVVAGVSTQQAALHHSAGTLEDIEIETHFGLVRPGDYKGFNSGGLELSGTSHPAYSPQTKTGYNPALGVMTPESQASKGSPALLASNDSPPFSRSPAIMQAVSPNPIYFGSQHDNQEDLSSSAVRERRKSRKHNPSKQGTLVSGRHETGATSSGRSVRSIFNLTPSSSSSSLSSYESSPCSAKGNRTINTTMNLGLGSGLQSSSTWSFGAPESPLGGYSSGGDSITGSKPTLECPDSPEIDSSPTRRYGQKKRRKEHHPTSVSTNQPASTRPMFELSLSQQRGIDPKGKQPDQSGLSDLKRCSTSEGQSHVLASHPSTLNMVNAGGSSVEETSVSNVSLASFQLPMPAYLSQKSGSLMGLDEWKSTSSSSSHGKQAQRKDQLQTLRSSVSSPCLQNQRGSTSSASFPPYQAPASLPVTSQESDEYPASYSMASMDLPPRSADWRYQDEETTTTFSSGLQVGDIANHGDSSEYTSLPGDTTGNLPDSRYGSASTDSSSRFARRSSEPELHRGSVSHFTTSTPMQSATGVASFGAQLEHLRPSASMATSGHSINTPTTTTPLTSTLNNGHNFVPTNLNNTPSIGHPTNALYTTTASTDHATNNYYPHPTSSFFTSPITSSCTATLAGTGVRVLGRSITMVMADNTKLVLRRSEPLILNEGVGEEKAARM
ncbi:cytochrome c oxidase subunit 1 [Mortierella sp. AD094]|nr:cytochrome c oxidase subunit 1 [Mortierella sp. AD094]